MSPRHFFLVGAPRCGTTSLAKYLRKHPQVCFSVPKETHFLLYAPVEWTPEHLRTVYLDTFFAHRRAEHRWLGDGSVTALYADHALGRGLALDPEARFLVMVRSPLELLPSLHQRFLWMLDEDVEDFAEAWRLQEARARGERLPPECRDPRFLQYRERALLGERVERLFEIAGRERVHVIVYDDFAARTREVYEETLAFLGLPSDDRTNFSRKFASRIYRSRSLHRVLYRPPVQVARWVLKAKRQRAEGGGKSRVKRLRRRLLDWNSVVRPPPPLPPALRTHLCDTLKTDVEKLSALLGRDLTPWLRDPA